MSCQVKGCKNHMGTKNKEGIAVSHHRFPKNKFYAEKWLQATGLSAVTTKTPTICEIHFSKDCYLEDWIGKTYNLPRKRKWLKYDAIPTLHLPENPNLSEEEEEGTGDYFAASDSEKPNDQLEETKNYQPLDYAIIGKESCLHEQILRNSSFEKVMIETRVAENNWGFQALKCPVIHTVTTSDCMTRDDRKIRMKRDSLELNQICIGCLEVKDVSTLSSSFIGTVSALTLYEAISKIKVNEKEVPAMICQNCMSLLSKIDEFIKMLHHSYKVLMEASNSINSLKNFEVDPDSYDMKKTETIHKALKQKMTVPLVDNMFQYVERQTHTKTEVSDESQVDQSYSKNQNNDMQLVQKKHFLGLVPGYKIYNNEDRVALVKIDEVPNQHVRTNPLDIEDETTFRDYCPFCSKTVRFFDRHLRYDHSVDWVTLRCLKCHFHHKLRHKLIEHCKSCGITATNQVETVAASNSDVNYLLWRDESEIKIEVEPTQVTLDDVPLIEPKVEKVEIEEVPPGIPVNTKKDNFVCYKCQSFSSTEFDKIEQHVMNFHYNEKECVLCKKKYTHSRAMIYHIKTFHGNHKCCKICLINFKNDQEAEKHYKSDAHCTCQLCGQQFQNRRQLLAHSRVHDSTLRKAGPFKCPKCPREYAHRPGVLRHMAIVHKKKRYLCDTCGQSYTTNRSLRLHNHTAHQGIKNVHASTYMCETCGKTIYTRSKYKLEMHKAKHIGHNFVCRRCYASFSTEDLHEQHMKELNHRLLECHICGATFVTSNTLRLHMENHANSQKTGSSSKLGQKGWPCRYCSKKLTSKWTLQDHEKLHTGERLYKCAECDQAFVKLTTMKRHRALHYRPEGIIIQRKQFQEKNVLEPLKQEDHKESV